MSETEKREIYVPSSGPPRVPPPSKEIYTLMGAGNIYRMLADFYNELEQSSIRQLFPEDMLAASRKNADFFIGLLGGPPIYKQKHGPPMLRARHLPFPIDELARQEWVRCFLKVLDAAEEKYRFPSEYLEGFKAFLREFSKWMVNRDLP